MKKLTCKELGGPCDFVLSGNTFEEIGMSCKDHVMVEINKGDEAHLAATDKMRNATPDEQKTMWTDYKKMFDEAPEL